MADKLKLLQDEIENAIDYLEKIQDEHIRLTGQRYKPPLRLAPKKETDEHPFVLWARRATK